MPSPDQEPNTEDPSRRGDEVEQLQERAAEAEHLNRGVANLLEDLEIHRRKQEHALARAEQAEAELRAAKAGLEELVRERTRQLQANEERLRAIVQQSPIPTAVGGADGSIVSFNRALEDLIGYKQCEIRSIEDWTRTLYPDEGYRAHVWENTQQALSGQQQGCTTFVITCKDGSERTTEFYTSFFEGGLIVQIVDITERKQAEEALGESEESYRELAESITDVFFAMDENLRYTFWNKASEALTGIRAEDALGRSLLEVFPDTPWVRRAERLYRDVLRTQQPRTFVIDADVGGGHCVFEISAYPSKGGISVFVRDITERRRAEEQIAATKAFHESILDAIVNGVWVTDERDVIQYANRGMGEIAGTPVQQIVGARVLGDFPESTLQYFRPQYLEARETLEPVYYDAVPVVTPAGRESFQSGWLVPRVEEGAFAGMICTVDDVTDRKRADEQVRFLSSVTEQVTDSIIVTDADFKIIYINRAAEELFGYESAELLGLSPDLLNAEPMAEEIQQELYRTVSAGETYTGEFLNRRKDGSTFSCEFRVSPILGDKGEIQAYVGVQRDVTERRRVEAELAGQRRGLRRVFARLIDAQEDERKSISRELHDGMGQALTAMQINLAEIGKALPPECPSEARERLAETRSLVEETLEQVRELAQGLRPGMLDDLGLVPTVRWYTNQFRKRLGIAVEYEAIGLEERLTSDTEVVFYRAVQEALTNVARHAAANRVLIRLERKESAVVALIEDDGTGFDAAQLGARGVPPRGIGLLGMRERAHSLGGTVTIESRPGRGTRLLIEIPVGER